MSPAVASTSRSRTPSPVPSVSTTTTSDVIMTRGHVSARRSEERLLSAPDKSPARVTRLKSRSVSPAPSSDGEVKGQGRKSTGRGRGRRTRASSRDSEQSDTGSEQKAPERKEVTSQEEEIMSQEEEVPQTVTTPSRRTRSTTTPTR